MCKRLTVLGGVLSGCSIRCNDLTDAVALYSSAPSSVTRQNRRCKVNH